MKTSVLFLTGFLLCNLVFAQNKTFDPKAAFTEAQKQLTLGNYDLALVQLTALYKSDSANNNSCYLLGYCYYKLNNKEKATRYFEKAIKNCSKSYIEANFEEKKSPVIAYYMLADCYYSNNLFDKSVKMYEKYRPFIQNDPVRLEEFELETQYAINGAKMAKYPVKINILNLGETINSEFDDINPLINIDETVLVFSSNRIGSTGGLRPAEKKYDDDIYFSRKVSDKWSAPQKISTNINTKENEECLALSPDGQELFISRYEQGNYDIYSSRSDGTDWSKPEKLDPTINSASDEIMASISPDGSTLFFVSNKPGGFGGYDIYMSKRLPGGHWGKAINLGAEVNTKLDDAGPFIHQDGHTLYFSSKGHNSMGGYDLFFTIMKEDSSFSKAENLGYPVNSINNDIFYVLSADGKRAYFSTDRKDSYGGKDIYLLDLISLPERSLIVVNGIIRKKGSNDIVKDITLHITDAKTGELIGDFKPNKQNGKYLIVLPKFKEYKISCLECSYVFSNDNLIIPENSSYFYMQKPVVLDPITTIE